MTRAATRPTSCTVARSRDTSGTRLGPRSCPGFVRPWEVCTENPIRWPVSARRSDTGHCGSEGGSDGELGEGDEGGRRSARDEACEAHRVPREPPRAQAPCGGEVSKRPPLLRQPPPAPQLAGARPDSAKGASAGGPPPCAHDEEHRDHTARAATSGSAPQGERAAQAGDRSPPLLRRLRTRLEPVELQAVVRILMTAERGRVGGRPCL